MLGASVNPTISMIIYSIRESEIEKNRGLTIIKSFNRKAQSLGRVTSVIVVWKTHT